MLGAPINGLHDELPKKIHILKRYYGYGQNLSETQKLSQLIHEIKAVYQSGGIETVHLENIRLKLKTLIKKAKLIISTRRLSTDNQKKKELEFRRDIESIFAVAGTSSDPHAASTSTSNTDFDETSSIDHYEQDAIIVDPHEEDLYSAEEEEIDDDEYEQPPPQKKQKISRDLLQKINSECGQNASYRVMSSFIGIGIEIAGGDPKAYCISKSQLQRQLVKFRSVEKNAQIEELGDSILPLLIQFDTKSCSKLNKRHLGINNRVVVILRSEKKVIALGPYILSDHGAEKICMELINIIEEHNLNNRIAGIVCDTENTNTGHISGVCVRLENYLERDLLYFMCRHHIYDLILKHVSEFLFGRSTAPTFDFGCCTILKRAWENLNLQVFAPYYEIDNEEEPEENFIKAVRENAIHYLTMQAGKKHARDDYAELTDLALKFLGQSDIETKKFMVPGSVNNARWMGRAIYALKCFLFRYQINLDDDVLVELRRFSFFISTIYVKYWNWCTNVFNAPINDLQFLKELENYRQIDNELADVAIGAFSRHLTYLSDELVILSLFSKLITNEQKEAIRLKLVHEVGQRTEHSIRRVIEGNISHMELHDFISERSMFLFSTLGIDSSFLEYETSEWENLDSYHIARRTLKSLLVAVNDSVERALGQTANMINHQKARTEENLQNLLTCKLNS